MNRTRALVSLVSLASLAPVVVALALSSGCEPPEASADVLVEGLSPSTIGALREPRAELVILDDEGRSARARVRTPTDDREVLVTSPLPVTCTEGTCQLSLGLQAGVYHFALHVFAQDRCGTESRLLVLSTPSEGVRLGPGQRGIVPLSESDFSFDDDGDGIENALELAVCGRVDVPDAIYTPPRACGEGSPCCPKGENGERLVFSDLIGRATHIPGNAQHLNVEHSVVQVADFFLDATEVPYGALERCVAAGACLYGKPEHPARVALANPALRRDLPVVGLDPREAEELCAFLGKRLPTDDEWDFVAAFRDNLLRAPYPWSDTGSGAILDDDPLEPLPVSELEDREIGCWPTDEGPSANHRATGRSCPRRPMPVGSYGSSHVRRGVGAPIADLAGNVYEWTRVPATMEPAEADPRFPANTARMYLRGGNHDAPPQLLENDLRVRVRPADLERLVPVAGVRCARSLEAGEDPDEVAASLLPPLEPSCPAAEGGL